MRLHLRCELAKLLALTTTWALFVAAPIVSAQDHVVPLAEVERALYFKTEARARSLEDIDRVLSLPAATKELQRFNLTERQIHAAVSTLSDKELARLAQQARDSEQDVQGGFIVGILALIGLIVVIVIVLAVVAH